jgi:DNA-binding CsgD family transcriptional regulator
VTESATLTLSRLAVVIVVVRCSGAIRPGPDAHRHDDLGGDEGPPEERHGRQRAPGDHADGDAEDEGERGVAERDCVYGALRAGAVGFILKDAGPGLLAEAARAASAGDALISPSITLRLLQHLAPGQPGRAATLGPSGRASAAARPVTPLSERETEVIGAIATARVDQEIGTGLFISLSTVKSHLASIQQKLGLRNRVEIAGWARETGLIDPAAGPRPGSCRPGGGQPAYFVTRSPTRGSEAPMCLPAPPRTLRYARTTAGRPEPAARASVTVSSASATSSPRLTR